jgi:uncharacterized protein (TIGR02001 family)
MKKTILALAALAVGASAYAQEAKTTDLSVTLDLTYVTDYVFRGATLAGASFQPSVEAAYGDFYAGVWHSDAISGTNTAGIGDSETDFYAGYGFAVTEKISIDVGATRYVYSGGSSGDTTEAYAGLSFDVLLSPSVYYYYDFDLEISSYIGSIGYSLPVESIGTSLDFSGSVGYIQRSGLNGDDYTYGSVGVSVPYKLSDTATLTAGVQYILNDTDALDGDNDLVVGTVGISIGF